MAWLMTRKAVFTGKITETEAATRYRLDCRDVCLNQHIQAESVLPKKMTELLDKSYELYQRVARLDDNC
jgi:regulator of CtrA degradation